MRDDAISIDRLLLVVLRRWPIVVACVLLLGSAGYAFAKSQQQQYEASATLLFRDSNFDQKLFSATFIPPNRDPDREAQTNVALASLPIVAAGAVPLLGRAFSVDELRRKVTVRPAGRADVVKVIARDTSPVTAARIANAWSRSFIATRRVADRAKIAEAQRLVARELSPASRAAKNASDRRSLEVRAQQLEILASLQTGNTELAQPAMPPLSPVSPRPVRNGAVGVLLGLLVGLFAAGLRDRLDRRLSVADEASEIFSRPVLGVIPTSVQLSSQGYGRNLEPRDAEAFRMLRSNLRFFNVDHEIRSVVVTSAGVGDGKSTIASQLALVAARSGVKTLLLECDLRRPSLRAQLERPGGAGLTGYLAGFSSFSDVIETHELAGADGDAATLDIVFAGATPPNPAELLESDRMSELLLEVESEYELVVIDTPPVTVVSDAIPLLRHASGVLVVVRLRKTTREDGRALRERLTNLGVSVLGVVVNDDRAERGNSGYYYDAPSTVARA